MTYAILNNGSITSHGPAPSLWPDCSFPADGPNDAFLSEHGAVRVRSDLPHDPETEQLVPCEPYILDGEVFNRVVEPLPTPPPTPEWVAFGAALVADSAVNALVATVAQAAPALHLMLGVGLGQAAQGDARTFSAAWQAARSAGLVSPTLAASTAAMAASVSLPAEFLEVLNPAPEGGEP